MRTSVVKKTATLREQVIDAVLNELKNGDYAPGARLTEEALAKRLEVSRTPIREALGQLTRQGVLCERRGGGYLVPSPTIEQVRHIIAVRTLLEPPAVRMAADEYGPEQIDRLSKAIKAEAAAVSKSDPVPFAQANEQFRRAIFDGLANKALSALIAQFDSHLHFIRATTLRDVSVRRAIVARQTQIRDVLKGGDGGRAEMLWRSYLNHTEEVLTAAMRAMKKAAIAETD